MQTGTGADRDGCGCLRLAAGPLPSPPSPPPFVSAATKTECFTSVLFGLLAAGVLAQLNRN
eukprot:1188454-Prorocentrum_minimum.AAC.4